MFLLPGVHYFTIFGINFTGLDSSDACNENKVVTGPFYGLQNETIIDVADSGREYYTFCLFFLQLFRVSWYAIHDIRHKI